MAMRFRLALLLAGFLGALPAVAHHSAAALYDLANSITIQGTVTQFRLVNPHSQLFVEVQAKGGAVEQWVAVGDAAAVLRRRGWNADTLKKGDRIKVIGNPARDGSKSLEWQRIVLPNGTELLGGNGGTIERDRALQRLEEQRKNPTGKQ
jgi:hypothetical protein